MITLQDFLTTTNFQITNGSEYRWNCYGNNARCIDVDSTDYTASIVFDTNTQEVYETSVCDYKNTRAFRLINPMYYAAYLAEAVDREVSPTEAWDLVNFVELTDDVDFLEKLSDLAGGNEYDPRVSIEIDLDLELELAIYRSAHEQDITANEFVSEALRTMISIYNDSDTDTDTDNIINDNYSKAPDENIYQ